MKMDWKQLIEEMQNGSVRALARLITRVENRDSGWIEAMQRIYPYTGRARIIGITGSPGAGKSTLTDRLARIMADESRRVGIIAVDPSSPFSGGALLGDRLRMNQVTASNDIFFRSMATRGALGGLCVAARDVVKIMDAFGMDTILIETVGVGQDEVDVVKTADMVSVVCVPGMGDGVQAIKAGIMEIADIFIINKADHEGSDQAAADIRAMLELAADEHAKEIPVEKTVATTGEGIPKVADILMNGRGLRDTETDRREKKIRDEISGLLEKEVARRLERRHAESHEIENAVRKILARELDPYTFVKQMLDRLL
ncbi:methylmalonyl Co-A mutase-associated GTPase MeaB [Desulfosarcina alkanivorans]|uniref:Methylmalonyl Co-A mutase-associated GTPase MeaB n=1 Tax=Desulfosarcina alkanivorans TaxID=571177 RepID=A0A5K7YIV9_9BACT|nr:methylmalonyl Co-A mutase-associated GTPase MeaB [Desulfosarcina alkanivorans]BBO68050.1 methylmalonyl Co-A mutase-associated GTPase MeaB [Desulfosarcina alkanivorans]